MITRVYWLDVPNRSRLAIMARPRGGDWLFDEVSSWRHLGINHILSLLTDSEMAELELMDESRICITSGIEFQRFPIEDRGVPLSANSAIQLIDDLWTRLVEGRCIGIHCRMGIGRSAMIAAGLLRRTGFSTDAAFELIQRARGVNVPDTEEQRAWVAALELGS